MGEKPLSIDEAPAQTAMIAGAGPSGGEEPPPPGSAAAGINTTRSNIKHATPAAVAGTGPQAGGDLDAGPLPGPEPQDGALAVKEQGVKYGEAATGSGDQPASPGGDVDDSAAGQGAGGAAPNEAGAPGVAGYTPIPGIDIIVKKER